MLANTSASCIDGGSIEVAALSGTAPFSFQVDGGPWQNSGVFAHLPAGNHTVTLRDAAGCQHENSYPIAPPPDLADSLLAGSAASWIDGGSIVVAALFDKERLSLQVGGRPGKNNEVL